MQDWISSVTSLGMSKKALQSELGVFGVLLGGK